jgi:outer membrane protein TolC
VFTPELLLDAGYNDFGQGYKALSQQESVSASLAWDLSPSLFAQSDLLIAELLKAEHGADAAHRRVSAELVRAQIATLSADDLLETTHRRVEAAKAAVALESIRHEAGDALLIELLDAEVSLRRAETAKAAAICSHNRAQHLLRQALGG